MEVLLSEYGALSREPSPVNRMMSSFASEFREGIDINLGVGYVNENTIPRTLIRKALTEVLAHPRTYRSSLNYGGPQGSARLIESIREYYLSRGIGGLTRDVLSRKQIIIGPDGATSILEGIARVLRPGIVITTDPMYYIYTDFLERSGFTVVTVPERADGLHADDVAARLDALGERGLRCELPVRGDREQSQRHHHRQPERSGLVRLAAGLSRRLERVVPLVLDKAYEDLIHDPSVEKPRSGLLDDEMGVVLEIGTLSKIIAPGLRIGYMIAEDGPFLQAMIQRTSDVGFSAPLINQEIASWLLDNAIDRQLERVNHGYRQKALAVKGWLDSALGDVHGGMPGGPGELLLLFHASGVCTSGGFSVLQMSQPHHWRGECGRPHGG